MEFFKKLEDQSDSQLITSGDTARNLRRRKLARILSGSLVSAPFLLPTKWQKSVIDVVLLPAHAQLSPPIGQCQSGTRTETILEPIVLQVTATEVAGPITVARNANSFSGSQETNLGACVNGSAKRQVTSMSGSIDINANTINGELIIELFCGDVSVCIEEANIIAPQLTSTGGVEAEEGSYEGNLTGTITCCQDLEEGQV